jgi:hypothetical protein
MTNLINNMKNYQYAGYLSLPEVLYGLRGKSRGLFAPRCSGETKPQRTYYGMGNEIEWL